MTKNAAATKIDKKTSSFWFLTVTLLVGVNYYSCCCSWSRFGFIVIYIQLRVIFGCRFICSAFLLRLKKIRNASVEQRQKVACFIIRTAILMLSCDNPSIVTEPNPYDLRCCRLFWLVVVLVFLEKS